MGSSIIEGLRHKIIGMMVWNLFDYQLLVVNPRRSSACLSHLKLILYKAHLKSKNKIDT